MFIPNSILETLAEEAFINITVLNCTYENLIKEFFSVLVRKKSMVNCKP